MNLRPPDAPGLTRCLAPRRQRVTPPARLNPPFTRPCCPARQNARAFTARLLKAPRLQPEHLIAPAARPRHHRSRSSCFRPTIRPRRTGTRVPGRAPRARHVPPSAPCGRPRLAAAPASLARPACLARLPPISRARPPPRLSAAQLPLLTPPPLPSAPAFAAARARVSPLSPRSPHVAPRDCQLETPAAHASASLSALFSFRHVLSAPRPNQIVHKHCRSP